VVSLLLLSLAQDPGVASDRFEAVVRRVMPAVVGVDAVKAAAPAVKGKPAEESGSGVLVRLDGPPGTFALTNNHVVAGSRPEDIAVTLADGRILSPAQVWTDPASDLAVLRLTATDLPTADLGDSDRVRVGQWVLAFGSPFGLSRTVTHGIISARDRGQVSLGPTIRIREFLQTDAAINPGSSGGPLADLSGQVVGINTAILSSSGSNTGVSFAIPATLARRVARELVETGRVRRGYIGLNLYPSLEPATARRLGLDRVWGAHVEYLQPNGPAARAGVQVNDVVLGLDDVAIRDENHLINLIGGMPAGQRVRLRLWRGRQERTAEVTVEEWGGRR
jgi:S1-C subfamily serine protease